MEFKDSPMTDIFPTFNGIYFISFPTLLDGIWFDLSWEVETNVHTSPGSLFWNYHPPHGPHNYSFLQ